MPGELRERTLSSLPPRRCELVVVAERADAVEDARKFHRTWDPTLSLFRNDCRHHTTALVRHLTVRGVKSARANSVAPQGAQPQYVTEYTQRMPSKRWRQRGHWILVMSLEAARLGCRTAVEHGGCSLSMVSC